MFLKKEQEYHFNQNGNVHNVLIKIQVKMKSVKCVEVHNIYNNKDLGIVVLVLCQIINMQHNVIYAGLLNLSNNYKS